MTNAEVERVVLDVFGHGCSPKLVSLAIQFKPRVLNFTVDERGREDAHAVARRRGLTET